MLSGEVPFVSNGKSLGAVEIMTRIKCGEFGFNSPSWLHVSESARRLVHGEIYVLLGADRAANRCVAAVCFIVSLHHACAVFKLRNPASI